MLSSVLLQVFTLFNRLGLCKGVFGTRVVIDNVKKEFDDEIRSWRNAIVPTLRYQKKTHKTRSAKKMIKGNNC